MTFSVKRKQVWRQRWGIKTGRSNLSGGRGKAEDGEPLSGAEDEESRPAGATPTGDGEAASDLDLPIYPDLKSLFVPKTPDKITQKNSLRLFF